MQIVRNLMNPWRQRQRQLAEQRRHLGSRSTDFELGSDQAGQLVLDAVLRELHSYLYDKDLVLQPSDRLDWLLGIDLGEATDAMERIVTEIGCSLPVRPHVVSELETVSDLVREVRTYVVGRKHNIKGG